MCQTWRRCFCYPAREEGKNNTRCSIHYRGGSLSRQACKVPLPLCSRSDPSRGRGCSRFCFQHDGCYLLQQEKWRNLTGFLQRRAPRDRCGDALAEFIDFVGHAPPQPKASGSNLERLLIADSYFLSEPREEMVPANGAGNRGVRVPAASTSTSPPRCLRRLHLRTGLFPPQSRRSQHFQGGPVRRWGQTARQTWSRPRLH